MSEQVKCEDCGESTFLVMVCASGVRVNEDGTEVTFTASDAEANKFGVVCAENDHASDLLEGRWEITARLIEQ